MTESEARKSLSRWRSWATRVVVRWGEGSLLAELAHRRVLEAQLRLLEIQAAARLR